MMVQASLQSELASIVGSQHVRPPDAEQLFAVDGVVPQLVVAPGTYEEVASVMRFANDSGFAVIPCGEGQHTFLGNVPRRYDMALSLSRLNQIVEYEPADLTLTCQAGTEMVHIHEKLSRAGQMLPFGSYARSSVCVGSLLARGTVHNLSYGGARDSTIGMRVVTPDGRTTRAGGKVVKNVAGYDLCKLYIGSLGTLGVIVEATFKLAPLPQAHETIELEFASFAEACVLARELRKRRVSLWDVIIRRSISLNEQGASPLPYVVLVAEVSGTKAAVDRSRHEIARLAQDAGVRVFDRSKLPKNDVDSFGWAARAEPISLDISVIPTEMPRLVAALDGESPGASIEAWPIAGLVVATWLGVSSAEGFVHRLRSVASRLGTVIVSACPLELKRSIDVFGDPPPAFDLMRRVKQQFDPNGILSPGRFVGRL